MNAVQSKLPLPAGANLGVHPTFRALSAGTVWFPRRRCAHSSCTDMLARRCSTVKFGALVVKAVSKQLRGSSAAVSVHLHVAPMAACPCTVATGQHMGRDRCKRCIGQATWNSGHRAVAPPQNPWIFFPLSE